MSATEKLVGVTVRGFPAELKAALVGRAEQERTSMRSVAVDAIAKHFSHRYRGPRIRRFVGDSDYIELTMPETLRTKLNVQAAREGMRTSNLVIRILYAAKAEWDAEKPATTTRNRRRATRP